MALAKLETEDLQTVIPADLVDRRRTSLLTRMNTLKLNI